MALKVEVDPPLSPVVSPRYRQRTPEELRAKKRELIRRACQLCRWPEEGTQGSTFLHLSIIRVVPGECLGIIAKTVELAQTEGEYEIAAIFRNILRTYRDGGNIFYLLRNNS